jgi:hypothetical protein
MGVQFHPELFNPPHNALWKAWREYSEYNFLRERPVSVLPMLEMRKDALAFDPSRRGNLDLFDQIRERDRGMQTGKDVKVIFNSANAIEVTLTFFEAAPNESV